MAGSHNLPEKMTRYQMNKVNCPHPNCEWGIKSNIEQDQSVVNIIAFHYANHAKEQDDLRPEG